MSVVGNKWLKWIVCFIVMLEVSQVAIAQIPTRNEIESAVYKAAMEIVFSELRSIRKHRNGSSLSHPDYFVMVPQSMKETIKMGRGLDNFVVDSTLLHQKLRIDKPNYILLLSMHKVANDAPYQYEIDFDILLAARKNDGANEKILMRSPFHVDVPDRLVRFTTSIDSDGKVAIKQYRDQ
jgi:hypothetical protein